MDDLTLPVPGPQDLTPMALSFLAGPHLEDCPVGISAAGEGFNVESENTPGFPWGLASLWVFADCSHCQCPAPSTLMQVGRGADMIHASSERRMRKAIAERLGTK